MPALSLQIDAIVTVLIERHPEWGDQRRATGACRAAACLLADQLHRAGGIPFAILKGEKAPPGSPRAECFHHAVEVEGVVVDLTYRQFVSDAPWPRVTSREMFNADWGRVESYAFGSGEWLSRQPCQGLRECEEAALHPELLRRS